MARTPKKYVLPNGLNIHHMNQVETDLIYKEVFAEEVYLGEGVEINEGDVVFDIGANIGLFALFLNSRYRDLKVYSFEPIPDIFEILSLNAQDCQNIDLKLFNHGVSDETTTAVFDYMPRFSCSSTMCRDTSPEQHERAIEFTLNAFEESPSAPVAAMLRLMPKFAKRMLASRLVKHYTKTQKIECQLKTVSDLIRENNLDRVDVLKIDVEGAEIRVLQGIEEEHWPLIGKVLIEAHEGEDLLKNVRDILHQHGFETHTDDNPSAPTDTMVYALRSVKPVAS